jgi:regulator of sigma D
MMENNMFDEKQDLNDAFLSNQKRLAKLCTFPIDYIGDGVYGVYAQQLNMKNQIILLKTNKDVWKLFKFITDIAGGEAQCELSEMAIFMNDLEEMVEETQENSFDNDWE